MKKLITDLVPHKYAGALSDLAFNGNNTIGRLWVNGAWASPVDENFYVSATAANPFWLDKYRILRSNAFLVSRKKTQAFLDHLHDQRLSNRQKHAFEVAFLAGEVCSFLGLNSILAEAIALGHDVGYPPFGSIGVQVLRDVSGKNFKHAGMSVIVLQGVENGGRGWNLSYETAIGISNHSFGKGKFEFNPSLSLEARVVAVVDKFSFVFGDIQDAFMIGYFKHQEDVPADYFYFGPDKFARWQTCIAAFIQESVEKGTISFCDSDVAKRFNDLRIWSYECFYGKIDREEPRTKAYAELLSGFNFLQACARDNSGKRFDPFLIFPLMTDTEAKLFAGYAQKGKTPTLDLLKKHHCVDNVSHFKLWHNPSAFDYDINPNNFHVSG